MQKNVKKHLLLGLFICLFLSSCTPASSDAVPSVTLTPSATPLPEAAPLQAVKLGVLGKGSARDFAWSPDGKVLAVLSTTGIYLYDTQSWEVLDTLTKDHFDGAESIFAITFSPADAHTLVVVTNRDVEERAFWKYDLESKQFDFWLESVVLWYSSPLVFSPDGESFALLNQNCERDEELNQTCWYDLELHESDSGELLHSFKQEGPHVGPLVSTFVFSPDGSQLAVARADNLLHVWDTASGELLYVLQHDSNVADVSYSPDGQVIASTGKDAVVRFWDAKNGESLFVLRGFKRSLQTVDFLADGKKLLVGELHVNNFQEYTLDENFLPVDELDIEMEISRDYSEYYDADRSRTINAKTSPDSHRMAVLINQIVQIWNLDTGEAELMLPGFNDTVTGLAFSPDGNMMAVASRDVHLWDVRTQTWLATFSTNEAYEIRDVAFRPHSDQIAIVHSGKVQIWDTVSYQKIHENINTTAGCGSLNIDYSPDGKKIAIVAGQCGIHIRDADTGQMLQKIDIDPKMPEKIQFSSDGKELVAVSADMLQRWDLETGQDIYSTALDGEIYNSYSACIGANLLAYRNTFDSPCLFFDLETGQYLYDFAENRDTRTVALHPNDRLYARSNYDGISFLEATSGQFLHLLDFDRSSSILFSPDQEIFAALSNTQNVHLWDISSLALQAEKACVMTATPDPILTLTATPTLEPVLPLATPLPTQPTVQDNDSQPVNGIFVEKLAEYGFAHAHEAAWSPDGENLAIGTAAGAYLFQPGKQEPVRNLSPGSEFMRLAFSPDGRLLAGQITNDSVEVWNIHTGERMYRLKNIGCWNRVLVFSADSQQLSSYCGGSTYHWNMGNGSLTSKEKRDTLSAYSPDGKFAFQSGGSEARLLNSETQEIIKVFDVPDMAPGIAAFSPDGNYFLVWFYQFEVARTGVYFVGKDHKSFIQVWDISSNSLPELRSVLDTGDFYWNTALWPLFRGLAFSPDSSRVFTASGNGQVDIFDITSGDLLATLPDGYSIYLSPVGNRLITIGRKVQEWDVTPGREPVLLRTLHGFSDYYALLAQIKDGSELVTASHGEFRFWVQNEAALSDQPTIIETRDTDATIHAVSPDGNWLAYSTDENIVLGKNSASDPDWQSLKKFSDHPSVLGTKTIVFSPDSTYLAVTDADFEILLWDLNDPMLPSKQLEGDNFVSDLIFSPDSSFLLGVPKSNEVHDLYLWDTSTGELLRTWKHKGYSFALHPDGVTLAVDDYDQGQLSIFRLDDWTLLQDMQGQKYVFDVTFSPDGRLLVTCGEDGLEFWDAATGTLLKTIEGSYSHLIFSPDGKILTAGSRDGRIRIFDVSEE
jgi:WD40 repeat protein